MEHAVGQDVRTLGEPAVEDSIDVDVDVDAGVTCHAGRPPGHHDMFVRLDGGAHGAVGVMESGPGRSRRNAERLGDLGGLEPDVVVRHEHGAVVRWEAAERLLELVAVDDGERRIHRPRLPGTGVGLELHGRMSTTRACRLVAAPNDDAGQPGIEPAWIAEPRQLAPGDHERLLHGVLGQVEVTQDPPREPELPVTSRSGEMDERVHVPGSGQ